MNPIYKAAVYDFSEHDAEGAYLYDYFLSLRESGFRAASFFNVTALKQLHTHAKQCKGVRYGVGQGAYIWEAIRLSPELGEEFLITYAGHLAARFNCVNALRRLELTVDELSLQDTIEQASLSGLTALHHSAFSASVPCLEYLLSMGIDHAIVDKKDNTFLHALVVSPAEPEKQLACFHVVKKCLAEMIPDPLDLKAFYQTKNTAGETALDLAAKKGNKELTCQFLFVLGADMEPVETRFSGMSIHYGRLLAERIVQIDRKILGLGNAIEELERKIMENTAAKVELRASVGELREAMENQNRIIAWQQRVIMMTVNILGAAGMMPPEVAGALATPAPCVATLAWGADEEIDPVSLPLDN